MPITVEAVREALRTVMDPELHEDLVTLDFVRDIRVQGSDVSFSLMLTTPACPLKETMRSDCERALREHLPDIGAISIRFDAQVRADRRIADKIALPIGNIIAVSSGKGGVGKSTVTANLAVALAQQGHSVALIDADVYGPTMPLMMGLPNVRPAMHDGKVVPPTAYGVQVVSMGLFLDGDEPVIWRGPLLGRAIEQFLGDVLWGSPDFLLIDLPPGTGDIALTIAQMIPGAEMVIVTTPQEAASRTAIKAAKMAQMTKHTVAGVIENMAYFECPECGSRHHIFGRGGAFEIARLMQTRILGRVPLDEGTRQGGDAGQPAALDAESPVGSVFHDIARSLAGEEPESGATETGGGVASPDGVG